MPNKKSSAASTVAFGALVVLICLFFAFYSQMNTASALFDICFGRDGADSLLAQDTDWYGSDELRALQAEGSQQGVQALEELGAVSISFRADSAGSLFVQGEAELTAQYYSLGSSRTAVLLHPYGRGADYAARWAGFWLEKGYNILIPQLRGHDGSSELTTLGFYEQYDLFDLLKAAGAETGVSEYVLHGEGMGANAALLLCGNTELMNALKTESGIEITLVAAESASTGLFPLITHQASRQFEMRGTLSRAAMKFTLNQKLGFSPEAADVSAACARSQTPTVFICGEDDGFAPAEWTRGLYDACTAEKELLTAAGAGHSAAWELCGGEYRAAIESLLK